MAGGSGQRASARVPPEWHKKQCSHAGRGCLWQELSPDPAGCVLNFMWPEQRFRIALASCRLVSTRCRWLYVTPVTYGGLPLSGASAAVYRHTLRRPFNGILETGNCASVIPTGDFSPSRGTCFPNPSVRFKCRVVRYFRRRHNQAPQARKSLAQRFNAGWRCEEGGVP